MQLVYIIYSLYYQLVYIILLRLLEKQSALHLPVFSIFFFSMTSPEYRGIRSKKIFANHHTSNTQFREPFPVRKMHDCYSGIYKNFEQHSIPIQAMQAITMCR